MQAQPGGGLGLKLDTATLLWAATVVRNRGHISDGATGALQEQVRAFTAGKFGLGAEVTCHLSFLLCHLPQTIAGAACSAYASAGGGGLEKIRYGDAFEGGSHCVAWV